MSQLSFVPARADDAPLIADLVNCAYHGDKHNPGWTSEGHLFDGRRTDDAEIRGLLAERESTFLLCVRASEVIGSVHVKNLGAAAYLGMLVVKPGLQGAGTGKRLMAAAEDLARRTWGSRRISISVINRRPELIAFYERRGYRRTGQSKRLPAEAPGTPRFPDIELVVMEKDLA